MPAANGSPSRLGIFFFASSRSSCTSDGFSGSFAAPLESAAGSCSVFSSDASDLGEESFRAGSSGFADSVGSSDFVGDDCCGCDSGCSAWIAGPSTSIASSSAASAGAEARRNAATPKMPTIAPPKPSRSFLKDMKTSPAASAVNEPWRKAIVGRGAVRVNRNPRRPHCIVHRRNNRFVLNREAPRVRVDWIMGRQPGKGDSPLFAGKPQRRKGRCRAATHTSRRLY